MAFIDYLDRDAIDPRHRVDDEDNILRIHGVHGRVMRLHYDLYVELMHRSSPLTRVQREMVAVVVSDLNGCEY